MNNSNYFRLSRRAVISNSGAALIGAATALSVPTGATMAAAGCGQSAERREDILGQGLFRYRAFSHWGQLDHHRYPVKECHGITEDSKGRVVLLTNDTHNNLIAYSKNGTLDAAWEHRFPGAHGFDIVTREGVDYYWITDHTRQLVSVCTIDGKEVLQVGPDAVASQYPDLSKYHPTNTATLPDGDFFISDGYGSSFVHHFDPQGHYISSFGGKGYKPEQLDTPHAVFVDNRSGRDQLLICDRGHNSLKWFSVQGELLQVLNLGVPMVDDEPLGVLPCNVARFTDQSDPRFKNHLAVACLFGVVLILDGSDRVVSVVGGEPPQYLEGQLQQLDVFNYTFRHPHDVCVDAAGSLYVAQWGSNRTYPIKLELVEANQGGSNKHKMTRQS